MKLKCPNTDDYRRQKLVVCHKTEGKRKEWVISDKELTKEVLSIKGM